MGGIGGNEVAVLSFREEIYEKKERGKNGRFSERRIRSFYSVG